MIFAMAFAQYKANWLVPVGAVTYALVWELSNKKKLKLKLILVFISVVYNFTILPLF